MNKVELGKCPYCNSDNYSRQDTSLEDDFVRVDCCCNDCEKDFVEYFSIDEVKFEKDGEEFIYNNALFKKEKEWITELIKEEIGYDYGMKFEYEKMAKRIINIMNGGVNEDD